MPQVRLIDQDGSQIGIVPIRTALEKAEQAGLDLVEIAPNAAPPVCKIIDFGKYKYEITKREKEGRKKQHTITVKEIRLRSKIDKNDRVTKIRQARKFVEHGDRVKLSLQFRGREFMHKELGENVMKTFLEAMEDIAKVEMPLTQEGQTLIAVISKK